MNINITNLIRKAQKISDARTPEAKQEARAELENTAAFKKITAELEKVQKRTTARNITEYDIIYGVKELKNALDITMKALEGVYFTVDTHAQKFPNSYRFTPESTHYLITVWKGNFYLSDVYRDTTRTKTYLITHTQASKAAIVDRFTAF